MSAANSKCDLNFRRNDSVTEEKQEKSLFALYVVCFSFFVQLSFGDLMIFLNL